MGAKGALVTASAAARLALFKRQALLAAAFLTPALSLALPSGYSWGAGLLVLLGLVSLPSAIAQFSEWPRSLRWWALATLVMGLAWAMHTHAEGRWLWSTLGLDRPLKYVLSLIALMALVRGLPSIQPLRWGCWAGSAGAGVVGLWQWGSGALERASGFTNAIQFGNLSLLLAVWSWVWARHAAPGRERLIGHSAALLGALACMVSGSRGGWIVAPVLVLMVLLLDKPAPIGPGKQRRRHTFAVCGLVVGLSIAAFAVPEVRVRTALAVQEAQNWRTSGQADSSVGQRLEHWTMAWHMALQKPVLGWGQTAYDEHKRKLVAEGRVAPFLLHFNHAHHEWIDMFAKRGLVGVLALALFFGVPAAAYWPLRQRAWQTRSTTHALALCGLLTVVGFVGFGMTQVMFAHNNAHMMYLFMNSLWLAALATLAARPDGAAGVAAAVRA